MKIVKLLGWLFAVIGIVVLSAGIYFHISDLGLNRGVKTEARIVYMNVEGRNSTVIVEFQTGGQIHSGTLDHHTSSMYVTQLVDIYYNPNNPDNFRSATVVYATYIMSVVGFVLFIIGVSIVRSFSVGKVNKKKILKYNHVIDATISKVRVNHEVLVENKNPFVIETSYQNQEDGRVYYFRSEDLWFDPAEIIMKASIRSLPIYVNPNNFKEYVVDLTSITKYLD